MLLTIKNIENFMRDEEGLTIVEYLIGAGLMVLALNGMGAFEILEDSLTDKLSQESFEELTE